MFLIETEDFYKDIAPDVHKWFDTSNFPPNNSFGISTGVNKMVIGMFKDEVGGKIVIEFVGLRAKNYSYLCDGEEYKKCKGIKKCHRERHPSRRLYKLSIRRSSVETKDECIPESFTRCLF